MKKSILIIGYNPVPTNEYKRVEGTALRSWNIALALNELKFDVTVAVWHDFPQSEQQHNGIKLVNYDNETNTFKKILKGIDVVIINSGLGDRLQYIYRFKSKATKIIVDALSPSYVEYSANSGRSEDFKQIREGYEHSTRVMNESLSRADYILIANDSQKHLYRGVLAGLGKLLDYNYERFVTLPAYIKKTPRDSNPIQNINRKINLLWFGAIYPWFNISDLIQAFKDKELNSVMTLTIVGGSNPYYPKDDIRFNGKYLEALSIAKHSGLIEKGIVNFVDWVDYEDRIEIFKKSDLAISLNSDSIENEYSFRLRVADLIGNGLPVVTDGRDYLGSLIIEKGVGFKIKTNSSQVIKIGLIDIANNRSAVELAKQKLIDDKTEFYIDGYINNLVDCIKDRQKSNTIKRLMNSLKNNKNVE